MPSAEQMETIKVYTTWTLDDPHGSRITELGDTPITVVRADDHAQQVAALRQEIADAKMAFVGIPHGGATLQRRR